MVVVNLNLELASNIRTNTAERLLRTISLKSMHDCLNGLFVDKNASDTPVNLFDDEDGVKKTLRYIHCKHLNDKRTIAFNQRWKQANDVFDEKRQIWIDGFIDTEKDDLFIPRVDSHD